MLTFDMLDDVLDLQRLPVALEFESYALGECPASIGCSPVCTCAVTCAWTADELPG